MTRRRAPGRWRRLSCPSLQYHLMNLIEWVPNFSEGPPQLMNLIESVPNFSEGRRSS